MEIRRRNKPTKEQLEDKIKACNCAGCDKTLLTLESWLFAQTISDYDLMRLGLRAADVVRGRINDRPYCASCLNYGKESVL